MQKTHSFNALRPPLSKTWEENRILTLSNAIIGSLVFIVTALLYHLKREDAAWVARVPYATPLIRVDRADDITELSKVWVPTLRTNGGSQPEVDLTLMEYNFQTQIDCLLPLQSPRCNCLINAYDVQVLRKLTPASSAAAISTLYRAFAAADDTTACFEQRGSFEVHVFEDDPSTLFDGVLFWWLMSSLLHLFLAARFAMHRATAAALTAFALLVWVIGVFVFAFATSGSMMWLAGVIALPIVPPVVFLLLSLATNHSRPVRHHKWWMWNDVVGDDGLVTAITCVGLYTLQRALLLFSKQNEEAGNWVVLWMCIFTGLCSGIVRFLRNSILDIHDSVMTLERLSDETTVKAESLESTLQSVTFTAQWTWFVLIAMTMALLLLFPSTAQGALSVSIVAARVGMSLFLVIFVLQIPTRHQRMPFTQPQQQLFFFVLEALARIALLFPFAFYLLS